MNEFKIKLLEFVIDVYLVKESRIVLIFIEEMQEFSQYIDFETERLKSLKNSWIKKPFKIYFFDKFLKILNKYSV